MKLLLVGFTSLFLGTVLGFFVNSALVFNGGFWPGSQLENSSADIAPSSNGVSDLTASKSVTTSEELSQPKPVSGNVGIQQITDLNFDDIKRLNTNASLADQQAILALVINADLDQVTSAIADIPSDSNRIHEYQWAVGLLLKRMIELDPEAAFEQVVKSVTDSGGLSHHDMTSYLMLENYARMQPDSLFDWLGSLSNDVLSPEHLMSIYHVLSTADPERVMDLVLQNEALSSNRFGGLEMVLYNWSSQDPQAALQWLDLNGDPQLLQQHAPSVISQLAANDLDGARALAEKYPDLVSEDLFVYQEIEALAATDPLAAIEMARSTSSDGQSLGAMHSVFYTWSMQDPIGAFEYVDSLSDPEEKRMFAQMVAGNIGSIGAASRTKQQELLDWSVTLSPELKAPVQQALISQWMEYEPEAAIEWLRYQGDLSEQAPLLRSLAWSLPSHDIQLSMDLFTNSDFETQMALSHGIVTELYQTDPTWAWSWYDELPDNDVKTNALHGLIMTTARDNPQGALDMASEKMSSGQDYSLESVVMMIASEYPDVVDSWLATSSLDESYKAQLLEGVVQMRSEMSRYGIPGAGGYSSSFDPVDIYQRQYQFNERF